MLGYSVPRFSFLVSRFSFSFSFPFPDYRFSFSRLPETHVNANSPNSTCKKQRKRLKQTAIYWFFSTHMFATQEKSEMLTLAEIFSLADISYKTFIKQPPNLSRGLLTGKRQSKKLPMKLTKLFSFLNLATHFYLQHWTTYLVVVAP